MRITCVGSDVIVFCHDFFGNYIENIDYFISLAEQMNNVKFILLNFPGNIFC